MRFKTMATITAVIFIVAGFGFAFQDMSLARFFGSTMRLSRPLPPSSVDRVSLLMMYAGLRSFVYMFGAAIFGCGLLVWAIRNLKEAAAQTNAALALFGLNAVLGAMALQQQLSIWRTKAGWIAVGLFFAQAIGYGWLVLLKLKVARATLATAEPDTQLFREQWAQQIHEAAAQQERNRLARELHDSIKQQLFSINVNAATVQARWENDEAGARTALEAVRNSVREAMTEMDAMLHNLRPAPLETVGLVEALRQQCEALQYRIGAQVTAEIGELPANEELPAGAQDALFRIVQEALANIARHARAANVRVRLHRQTRGDEDALWLKIEDDGSGFDVANAAAGMGLANIRSRVLEIGGALQLESREGEGTSLTVYVPLAATESQEVRRELRIAFVFTLVGFLLAGSWIFEHTGAYWPLAGLSVFLLSGLLCYRASRSIRRMKDAGASPPRQILELQSQLRQVLAVWIGALMWSLENWHIIAEVWHIYIPNETLFLILWPLLTVYAVRRVHQILRVQAESLTTAEFLVSLNRWWGRVSVLLGVAVLFLLARPGMLAYPVLRLILIWRGYGPRLTPLNFQPIRAFLVATLVLLLYWLYLTGWQLWLKRRAATVSLAMG
jgi:signal transduction histidine kinase